MQCFFFLTKYSINFDLACNIVDCVFLQPYLSVWSNVATKFPEGKGGTFVTLTFF